MMKRLDKSQYSRVMPIVRGLDRYLSVRAVLQEKVPFHVRRPESSESK
ncbi:hypothetical protein [Mesotoga sp. TolDC]|jgi:hypothetical protein|nr:hypothetical protein [Mesotoga sp. TolDC]